jgi:hypothetical protein
MDHWCCQITPIAYPIDRLSSFDQSKITKGYRRGEDYEEKKAGNMEKVENTIHVVHSPIL